MKKRSVLPAFSFYLKCTDPLTQFMVAGMFKEYKIPMYTEDLYEFNPRYPYLKWNGNYLTQSTGNDNSGPFLDLEKFLKFFFEDDSTRTFELNKEYTATIDYEKGIVKVRCQVFPFDKIYELVDIMRKKSE